MYSYSTYVCICLHTHEIGCICMYISMCIIICNYCTSGPLFVKKLCMQNTSLEFYIDSEVAMLHT